MTVRKTMTRAGVVLATLGAAAVVAPAPAYAGTPPSCVSTTILNFNYVRVYNGCGVHSGGFWIKVIWRGSPDSDCFFLGAYASATRRAPDAIGEYDKTITCR